MALMRLPRPNRQFGHYCCDDGSRIYQSLRTDTAGQWYVWLCNGPPRGKEYDGAFIMCDAGIRYFQSPQQALDCINEMKGRR